LDLGTSLSNVILTFNVPNVDLDHKGSDAGPRPDLVPHPLRQLKARGIEGPGVDDLVFFTTAASPF